MGKRVEAGACLTVDYTVCAVNVIIILKLEEE
jgi:hypothetical protein